MTLERKKVVTAQKHTNFQFVFFRDAILKSFFSLSKCVRPNGLNRKREREREEEEEKERARSLAHSPTLSH